MGHMAALEPSSAERRGLDHGTCDSARALLGREARPGATGHVVTPEPTSTGMCGPELQLAWQRVDAHPAPCLDLELVYGGTRSSV
jgi:hypothetical protein